VQAIQEKFDGRVQYAPGIGFKEKMNNDEVDRALELAKKSDVIIACMGESSYTEIEGNINSLRLPWAQYNYFSKLVETGKPIVLIMAGGRPRIISPMVNKSRSVLFSPYPGPRGGDAIANILAGDTNPSGRLPLTYPRAENALVLYDHKTTEQVKNGHVPLFPFGHGLSYSTFDYSDIRLSSAGMTEGTSVTATVTVTNKGNRAGQHSILLFTNDAFASITPSVRRLKKFSKIQLDPGQSQEVTFTLTPEDLAFVGLNQKWTTEPGTFKIMIGDKTTSLTFANK